MTFYYTVLQGEKPEIKKLFTDLKKAIKWTLKRLDEKKIYEIYEWDENHADVLTMLGPRDREMHCIDVLANIYIKG